MTALTGDLYSIEPRMLSLVKSRFRPFMDMAGLQTRSLETLMVEAYMAGMKDAVQVYKSKERLP